ncbi:MAG: hypothetical protein OR994_03280 [Candidatus Poseidoniales archaeon]|jgi:hypothetical protein|nr:hypothetical protein [Candidatus Poseidoniales archaeon]|tara:strand:- start:2503 stop:2796 length:294 start_codon:yes stop_codon:yes gene_type:complete
MATVNKAARGKHRWIGFQVSDSDISRTKCEQMLSKSLLEISWRLFDFKIVDGAHRGILKVPLEEYEKTLSLINSNESLNTLTSSGKIRLVRQRLSLK